MISGSETRLEFEVPRNVEVSGHAGAWWRGRFGAALRQSTCVTRARTCDGCRFRSSCSYGAMFETVADAVAEGPLSHHADVPHPYVLHAPDSNVDAVTSRRVLVELRLFGRYTDRLGDWLTAARSLNSRFPGLVLSGHETRMVHAAHDWPDASRMRMTLDSPLRIRRQERYLGPDELDFGSLFAALSRRVSMLHQLVVGRAIRVDYRELKRLAADVLIESADLDWQDDFRWSARQRQRIPLGGITGTLMLKDVASPLLPWLHAGAFVSVGKGAVMGLGRYRLEPLA